MNPAQVVIVASGLAENAMDMLHHAYKPYQRVAIELALSFKHSATSLVKFYQV